MTSSGIPCRTPRISFTKILLDFGVQGSGIAEQLYNTKRIRLAVVSASEMPTVTNFSFWLLRAIVTWKICFLGQQKFMSMGLLFPDVEIAFLNCFVELISGVQLGVQPEVQPRIQMALKQMSQVLRLRSQVSGLRSQVSGLGS